MIYVIFVVIAAVVIFSLLGLTKSRHHHEVKKSDYSWRNPKF